MIVRALPALLVALAACRSSSSPPAAPPPTPADANIARDAATASTTEVRVDRRVELISIVFRLGGGDEYRSAPATRYTAEVDKTFAPFRSHPAIAATRELRKTNSISFDAPMMLAIHLDAQLQPISVDDLPKREKRWAGVDVHAYAAKLRDFAEVTKFDEFFAAQRTYHEAVETKLRLAIEAENPVAWFDELFGARAKARYVVVPGLLTGTMNFGPSVTLPDGTLEMYQVLGVTRTDGMPETDADSLAILIHEMAHSYVNPLFARFEDQLDRAGTALYALVAPQMRAQAYVDWTTMLNESAVRALTVLYIRQRKGDAAAARAARREIRSGFVWTNELVDVFRSYQRDRASIGSIEAFMPKVIAFFDALATRYDGKLPALPFQGPFDAVFSGEFAVVVPATKHRALTAYIAGIFRRLFPKAPLVTASPNTFEETAGKHLIAYGSPATNAVIAKVALPAAWSIAPDGIKLGVRWFPGEHLVLIACWHRHDDPTRGIAVYAAADERDLVGINSVRHGMDDWIVARKTPGGYEVVARGDWPVSNGAWVPHY